jgi:hypothetical protein
MLTRSAVRRRGRAVDGLPSEFRRPPGRTLSPRAPPTTVCTVRFRVVFGRRCGEVAARYRSGRPPDPGPMSTNGLQPRCGPRPRRPLFTHVHDDLVGVHPEGGRPADPQRHTPPRPKPGRARLRCSADAGPRRRRAAGLGLGSELARRRPRCGLLLPVRVRGDRRLPPLLHPPVVQSQSQPPERPGDRRQPGAAG